VSATEVEKLVVEAETATVELVPDVVVALERKVPEAVDKEPVVVTVENVLATEVVTVASGQTRKQPILLPSLSGK